MDKTRAVTAGSATTNGRAKELAGYIDSIADEIIRFRETLHAAPELSGAEIETRKFILSNIPESEYISITCPENTYGFWVDIVFGGRSPGRPARIAALRADMDALPVREETGVPFASKFSGRMHACGHDAHMAALYGALRAAAANYDWLKSSADLSALRFIFQASEELSPGGALPLIAAGAMDGVEMAFGLHAMPNLPAGKAGLMEGPVMAAVDEFELELSGRGGHGAKPDEADDLILQAAEIITGAQKIISRNTSPFTPAVISFCAINAGTARNILPARAHLSGTVRSLDSKTRSGLRKKIESVISARCAEFGTSHELKWIEGYPVTINARPAVEKFAAACRAALGEDSVLSAHERSMGSEDFSYYAMKAPSAFAFFGCGPADGGNYYPLHHPRFIVDERAVINAAKCFAALCAQFCR